MTIDNCEFIPTIYAHDLYSNMLDDSIRLVMRFRFDMPQLERLYKMLEREYAG